MGIKFGKSKKIPKVNKSNLKCSVKKSDAKFEEFIYGNVWIRELLFYKKGAKKRGHIHNFDHIHYVARGSVNIFIINPDGNENFLQTLHDGCKIKVPAGVAHSVVALEDNTLSLCIQAVRDDDLNILKTNYIDANEDDVNYSKL